MRFCLEKKERKKKKRIPNEDIGTLGGGDVRIESDIIIIFITLVPHPIRIELIT